MKSTPLVAISLALFMLLLVLIAAFIFSFQGQKELKATYESNIDTVLEQEKQAKLESSEIKSTATAISATISSAQAENQDLVTRAASFNQTVVAQSTRLATQESGFDEIEGTMAAIDNQIPLVTIIEPQEGATPLLGEPVNIIIVASDFAGIKSINVSIKEELLEPSVPLRQEGVTTTWLGTWNPPSTGEFIIVASAINNLEKTSSSSSVSFEVVPPPSTETPTPTESPVPTTTSTRE